MRHGEWVDEDAPDIDGHVVANLLALLLHIAPLLEPNARHALPKGRVLIVVVTPCQWSTEQCAKRDAVVLDDALVLGAFHDEHEERVGAALAAVLKVRNLGDGLMLIGYEV